MYRLLDTETGLWERNCGGGIYETPWEVSAIRSANLSDPVRYKVCYVPDTTAAD